MKRFIIMIAVAALGVAMASCAKEERFAEESTVTHIQVLKARIAADDITKTYFDGATFKWKKNDNCVVRSDNANGFSTFTFTGDDTDGEATFTNASDDHLVYGQNSFAIYPAKTSTEGDKHYPLEEGGSLKIPLKNSYTWSDGNVEAPMLARVENGTPLEFKHLGGCLKVTYKNVPPKAASLVVSAPIDESSSYKICNTMGSTENWTTAGGGFDPSKTPYLRAYSHSGTYSISFNISSATPAQRSSDEGITVYIPLPVGPVESAGKNVYPKLRISLTFADGTDVPGSVRTASNVQIERAKIKPMPAISLPKYSIEVVAGKDGTGGATDGTGTEAQLQQLRGLVWLDNNTLALTQSNGDRKLRMYNKTTSAVTTSTNVIGAASGAPWQGAMNGGLLYIANKASNVINSYNPTTGEVVANAASVSGGPMCVRFHGGDAYVIARDGGKLYKYTGGLTGAQSTLFDFSALDLGSTSGEKNYPLTLAIDSDGNVIVPVSCAKGTSPTAYYVYVIKPDGSVLAKIGKGVKAANVAALADGASSNATFGAPNGIAIDNSGNIFLAEGDTNGGVIRKIVKTASDYSDAVVMTVLGCGSSYTTAVGATAAFSVNIMDVAFDPVNSNVFYVADQGRYTLRKVTIE